MEEPKYHLSGVVHTREESMEDFEGPLDVIFLLLSKNKIEIQDVSITVDPGAIPGLSGRDASAWIWRSPANLLLWRPI